MLGASPGHTARGSGWVGAHGFYIPRAAGWGQDGEAEGESQRTPRQTGSQAVSLVRLGLTQPPRAPFLYFLEHSATHQRSDFCRMGVT